MLKCARVTGGGKERVGHGGDVCFGLIGPSKLAEEEKVATRFFFLTLNSATGLMFRHVDG